MCFRVLNWLERETDADIYRNFVSARVAGIMPLLILSLGARALKRARCPLSGHPLLIATITSYRSTTRTPLSVLTLFIAAARHTFRRRSPSSIFSCAIIGPVMFAVLIRSCARLLSLWLGRCRLLS